MDALLDAGCGSGAFARAVAQRCDRVIGIDLSPGMISRAQTHSGTPSNIEYAVSDVFSAPMKEASFDAVVSIAAVHHMDMEAAFLRFASLLRPGGTLLVVDLLTSGSLLDRLASLRAWLLAPIVRFWSSGRLFQTPAVRAAWAIHEKHDSFTTLRDVRALSEKALPGSRVSRRLFWRYCLIWRRPGCL
jgi:ubiquinone/menaquinone biosynthesis C-methylase UbiE